MKLRNKKTGDIGYLELEKGDDEKYIGLRVYKNDFMYKRYQSLAELNKEWEDYAPLIKDEKVRKAVRAWAVAEGEDCYYGRNATTIYNGSGSRIDFWSKPFTELEEDRHYTITELCGEEE